MTIPAPDQTADTLAPVRAGLLREAHADAEALLTRTEREAATLLDQARAEAQAILVRARRQGEADGANAARDLLVRARREARSRTLAARREAYEELRREAAQRVRGLRGTDGYASLRERLEHRARILLGPDAEVSEHADGGVVARTPGKRADLSLTALADHALDRTGAEVRSLWEP
ncbi:V-type ATP synthase subunit E [Streptomyces sp. TRM S81-3]|uniref:V-type ATP synthase subunit E n=1 Tax=Streptomyces griseicoloratus TaxID=2752516 RepID=A0A926QSV2_9ACTN|nr:V-type ATP synthase subunit E [Streptomyces griseicoloratus]MBD0422708.1 V-type ATP synthase subunit E [Streptomyces griseicoloratus]